MELSLGATVFIATLVILVGFTIGAPMEADFDLQMDILNKIGVTEPWKFPSVDASTISVPDHLRFKFESMHRQHRIRRAYITKGIHKNADIFGEVSYTERNRQLFTFDISAIPEGSEIIMAELKVFKERPNHSIFKPDVDEDSEPPSSNHRSQVHSALVSLRQVTGTEVDVDADPETLAIDMATHHDGMRTITIDQREVNLNDSGWKVFDVTNTIQTWVADPDTNLGVAFHIDPMEGVRHARQVAEEMVFATDFYPDTPTSPDSRPVLVIYTTKYAPSAEPNECRYEGEEELRCCRRRKYVDFRDLSWTSRWIIEPAGFEAFDCFGPCHNPRSRHIRDLFRLPFFGSTSSGFGAGASSHRTCGVSRSSALPMMYLAQMESGIIELRVEEIPNMIVEDCGCMA
uniref:Lefty n=1 Tax=Temnopleurus reevesii TaxID=161071 RepID=A0A2Z5Z9T9_9ECHN|nr:Lefty [Temnopleurus reevesii]